MDYKERIEKRHSIREYRKKEISQAQIDELEAYFSTSHRLMPDIQVEMKIFTQNSAKRLEGLVGYHGYAFNAPAYILLLSEVTDFYLENAGFIGEDLILKLVDMKLDNCWLTVEDSNAIKTSLRFSTDKEVAAVIAFGYGKAEHLLQRLDIKTPSNVKHTTRSGHVAPKISQADLVYDTTWDKKVRWDYVDPNFDEAMYAASLAPSFLNRQPYKYVLNGSRLVITGIMEKGTTTQDSKLDVGATIFNFYITYSSLVPNCSKWNMGIPDDIWDMNKPDEYDIVGYFDL